MNLSVKEGVELVNALKEMNLANEVQTIVIPPFTHLYAVYQQLEGNDIKVGSQNNHQAEEGAFTGEVSAKMLKQIGVEYGLVGHSERRTYFHEDNLILKSKLDALLKNNINGINIPFVRSVDGTGHHKWMHKTSAESVRNHQSIRWFAGI